MNYFSYFYQYNMIRVFPLLAGVIDPHLLRIMVCVSVSPVCGGYRLC